MHSVTQLAYIWRIVVSQDYMPFDHWGLRTVVEDQSVCVIMLWLLVPDNVIDIRHWTKAVSHKWKYTWNYFGNIFIFAGIRCCHISSHAMDMSHKSFATPIKRAVCNNAACTNSDYVITWQSFSGALFERKLHNTFMCIMMTSSNRNIFRVTGPLCEEFTCHRWILLTKASDAELWCFPLICARMNAWVNNRDAGDLRRQRAHYDVIVMCKFEPLLRRMYFVHISVSFIISHHGTCSW